MQNEIVCVCISNCSIYYSMCVCVSYTIYRFVNMMHNRLIQKQRFCPCSSKSLFFYVSLAVTLVVRFCCWFFVSCIVHMMRFLKPLTFFARFCWNLIRCSWCIYIDTVCRLPLAYHPTDSFAELAVYKPTNGQHHTHSHKFIWQSHRTIGQTENLYNI